MSNGPYRDDSDLVVAARSGDGDAFARLYDAWFDQVHDVVVRIVRDQDIAAEVAQDTFLVTWQKLGTLREPASFGGWLLRAARNRAFNRLERERRSVAIGDEETVVAIDRSQEGTDDVAATAAEADLKDVVWAASAALGERDASILSLHLRHGLDGADLADELGVSANSANQSMFRLRARLGDAVKAWMLWRGGQPTCVPLRTALADAGITRFGRDTARTISRHAADCARCDAAQGELVRPQALFAAAPLLAVPAGFKEKVAGTLETHGVPIRSVGDPVISPGADVPGGGFDDYGPSSAGSPASAPGGAPVGPVPVPYPTTATGAGAPTVEAEHGDAALRPGAPTPPTPDDEEEDRRRRVVWWLIAASLLLVLPVAGVLLWPSSDGSSDLTTDTTATTGSPPSTTATTAAGPTRTRPTGVDGFGQAAEPMPTPTTTGGSGTTASPAVTTTIPPSTTASAAPSTTASTSSSSTIASTTSTTEPPPVIHVFQAERGFGTADCSEHFAMLTWSVTNADSVTISGAGAPAGPIAPSASPQIACVQRGPEPYTLTATGPGGTATATASVGPV